MMDNYVYNEDKLGDIYKKALNEGKTKQEAKKLSRIKGKHKGGNK